MNPAGFIKGAGIPQGTRVNTFVECGCCGAYHRSDFQGDCREDSERFADIPPEGKLLEPPGEPTCEMVENCREPIAYLDAKGYIYCRKHGLQRQRNQRCRQLRPAELRKLKRGETLTKY